MTSEDWKQTGNVLAHSITAGLVGKGFQILVGVHLISVWEGIMT